MSSQFCGLLGLQEITSPERATSCLTSDQQKWGILEVNVVEAAEEWKIGFKKHMLPIEDGE